MNTKTVVSSFPVRSRLQTRPGPNSASRMDVSRTEAKVYGPPSPKALAYTPHPISLCSTQILTLRALEPRNSLLASPAHTFFRYFIYSQDSFAMTSSRSSPALGLPSTNSWITREHASLIIWDCDSESFVSLSLNTTEDNRQSGFVCEFQRFPPDIACLLRSLKLYSRRLSPRESVSRERLGGRGGAGALRGREVCSLV